MKKKFIFEGQLFRGARDRQGLTQSELAEAIGVHAQFCSNWERGLCGVPKAHEKKAVKVLKIRKDEYYYALTQDAISEVVERVAKVYPSKHA